MKIYQWDQLNKIEQEFALERPSQKNQEDIVHRVQEIINEVKSNGDKSLKSFTKKFDKVQLDNFQVTEKEFEVTDRLDPTILAALKFSKQQIETYHVQQLPVTQKIQTCEGVFCERQMRPIDRVGLYIPGGTAPLVSTVLMLAVPAQLANCPTRIICTPCDIRGQVNPYILAAAALCGIEKIYKVGGAQAIAAMAYGTETIPKVDKIFGPGNAWVTQAKLLVSQDPKGASIDMPAGPSELMVIADDNALPSFVAADLLSQAEHGADSQVMLIVFSRQFSEKVLTEIEQQIQLLPRASIIKQSLTHSRIILVNEIEQAVSISNRYAPEHLSLQLQNPEQYLPQIQNAGAVFLGSWTPETVGDYVTGSNHVLPTYGYARNHSGLSLTDFMKSISVQRVTAKGLQIIGSYAETLASIEGLDAHKAAISLRLKQKVTSLCEI